MKTRWGIDSAEPGSFLSAPAIGKLNCAGDFGADVTLSGVSTLSLVLVSMNIGGSVAGTLSDPIRWAFNGNVGLINIGKDVTNLQVLGGASLGTGGSLTPLAATFSGTAIASFRVGGSVDASLISAGLNPTDGILLNGNDSLIAGGTLKSILIGSELDPRSQIVASSLPATIKIGDQTVETGGDARFKL